MKLSARFVDIDKYYVLIRIFKMSYQLVEISTETYKRMKEYCEKNSIIMRKWLTKLIDKELKDDT